jgi:hypothetical protein
VDACEKKKAAVLNAGNCRPSSSFLSFRYSSAEPNSRLCNDTPHIHTTTASPLVRLRALLYPGHLLTAYTWHIFRTGLIPHFHAAHRKPAGEIPTCTIILSIRCVGEILLFPAFLDDSRSWSQHTS